MIQIGAIAAVVLYFWKDIRRIAVAWVRGIANPEHRGEFDHRMGWYVIVGSLPIVIVGFLARDLISGPLRSLWWVAGALIGWSFFMVAAERLGTKARPLDPITLVDAIVMGVVQCLALIPGVSRSGATISAGLFRGLDRVAATRIAFLLGIPALVGAGIYELKDALSGDVGVVHLLVGTVVSFLVALRVRRLAAALRRQALDRDLRVLPGPARHRADHPARHQHDHSDLGPRASRPCGRSGTW